MIIFLCLWQHSWHSSKITFLFGFQLQLFQASESGVTIRFACASVRRTRQIWEMGPCSLLGPAAVVKRVVDKRRREAPSSSYGGEGLAFNQGLALQIVSHKLAPRFEGLFHVGGLKLAQESYLGGILPFELDTMVPLWSPANHGSCSQAHYRHWITH